MRFLPGLSVILISFAVAFAQSSAGGGTIQGTVKDVSGAVLPGAKVNILHIATGRTTLTEANADGYFATPPLNIGQYKVRVEAPGMKAWEGELQLETGKIVAIEPQLSAGQVTETVTVAASSIPLVTTTDPTDASTLDAQRIQELPINGRSLNTLLEDVTPGVEAINDVNGGVRVSGLMQYSTDYVQDGANANNREFGGSAGLQGLESVAEVRIETSTSSAKYTRPTSVIVTTRGGTNKLSGAVFETHRNNAFGVARARQDVFLDGRPYQTPKLIRNEFGGRIGGPVMLPKLYNGRNRTFFFVSREGVELRQGITRDFTVPTMAMRSGDFSQLFDSQGRKLTLYDPLTTSTTTRPNGQPVTTRLPFEDNKIPVQRMNALARRIWGITPPPTDITNPLVLSNLKAVVPTNGFPNLSDDPLTIRIDHTFSKKDNFFVKHSRSTRSAYFMGTGSTTGAPTANGEANTTYLPMQSRAIATSWNHMFSNTFFVETLVNRTWQITKTVTGPVDRNWSADLGLPNPLNEIGWPNITSIGFMNYVEGDNRRSLYSMITNAEQNYSLVRNTHNIQFGFRYHAEKNNLLPDQGAISGSVAFNSLATAKENPNAGSPTNPSTLAQTGYDAANFFLGYAGTYTVGLKRGLMRVRETNWGLYLQDNYKVSRRLTITPGLRWDINPAFSEKLNQLNAFDLASHSLMFPEPLDYYYKMGATTPAVVRTYERVGVKFSTAEELGKPKSIFPSNLFDIAPRVGFAYQLQRGDRQTVIRGGYGIYISALSMRTLLAQFSSLPPFRATFSYNPNSAAQSPDGIANYLIRNVPTVQAGVNSNDLIDMNNPLAIGRGVSVVGMDGNQPSLKVHEWNLTLEKQLNPATVFRVSYKGKHGVNADQLYEVNPQATDYIWYTTTRRQTPTGEFASVARRPYDQTAYSSVRILQRTGFLNSSTWSVEMERRFSKGLGFQAFYTLTNALRMGGNSFRDDVGSRPEAYLPGAVPTNIDELNRFLYYDRDTSIPKHRVRWNWIYDMPFGRGKAFGRGVPKWVDGAIGGWRFSGSGTVVSTWYTMPTNNWGEFGKFEVYGTKYKILDCTGTPTLATNPKDERCIPGYLWYNGYISERNINSRNAAGLRNGIFGLPDDYAPAQKPITPWPKNGKTTDPGANDYDTNVVYLPLDNGTTVRVGKDTGLHPWRNQYRLGPFNQTMDASMLKFWYFGEKRYKLRANVDVFNVFNVQGLNTPGSSGIVSLASSFGGFGFRPRQVQVNMRFEW